MSNNVDKLGWIMGLARIGVGFAGSPLLGTIQLLSEAVNTKANQNTTTALQQLADPIGSLHPDVPLIAVVLYKAMVNQWFLVYNSDLRFKEFCIGIKDQYDINDTDIFNQFIEGIKHEK